MKPSTVLLTFLLPLLLSSGTVSCTACGYDEVIHGTQWELWSFELGKPEIHRRYSWPNDVSYDSYSVRITLLGYDTNRLQLYYSDQPFGRAIRVFQIDLRTGTQSILQPDPGIQSLYLLSPDGDRFAYVKSSWPWLARVDGMSKTAIPAHPDIPEVWHVRWMPSGEELVLWSSSGLWVHHLGTGTFRRWMDLPRGDVAISADGRRIVYEVDIPDKRTAMIRLLDVESGRDIELLEGRYPRFVNLDQEIFFERPDGKFILDGNGEVRRLFGDSRTTVFVPSNSHYVGAISSGGLSVFDVRTDRVVAAVPTHHPDIQPESLYNWQTHRVEFKSMFFSKDSSTVFFTVVHTYSNDGC